MPMILENKELQLEIDAPNELYQGARFDWSGQISQIRYRNKHTFCTTENKDTASQKLLGRGLHNEFGIDAALGYEDCPLGEQFHKIGVGLLTKATKDTYQFYTNYDIEPAIFCIQNDGLSATFTVTPRPIRGHSYVLVKRIELVDDSFTIHYHLTNTGNFPIHTTEYVHNFLSMDGHPLDHQYILRFPFQIDTSLFSETVNPDHIVSFNDNRLTWNTTPQAPFFFSDMNPTHQQLSWELEHSGAKIGIREIPSFDVQRINVWGTGHVVSPEIFYPIHLLPGQNCKWARKYDIYSI